MNGYNLAGILFLVMVIIFVLTIAVEYSSFWKYEYKEEGLLKDDSRQVDVDVKNVKDPFWEELKQYSKQDRIIAENEELGLVVDGSLIIDSAITEPIVKEEPIAFVYIDGYGNFIIMSDGIIELESGSYKISGNGPFFKGYQGIEYIGLL